MDFKKDDIDVYQANDIEQHRNARLDSAEMILVALLSGEDSLRGMYLSSSSSILVPTRYSLPGPEGFGIKLACGLARYGLGYGFLKISYKAPQSRPRALDEWHLQLVQIARKDPKGLIGRRNPKLTRSIPSAPDMCTYQLYRTPAIMNGEVVRLLKKLALIPRAPRFPLILKLSRKFFWWKTHKELVKLVLPGLVTRTAMMAADFQAVSLFFVNRRFRSYLIRRLR